LAFVTCAAELGYSVVNLSALQPYIKEIGLVKVIGLIYAAFLLTEAAFKSPLGALGDRIGRRRLVVGGLLLSASCEMVLAHTRQWLGLIGIRILDGLGAAAVWPSVYALAGDLTPEGGRGGVMGLLNMSYIGALATGPALGGVLNDTTGSRRASLYLAAMVLAVAALVARGALPARWRGEPRAARSPEGVLRHLIGGMRLVPDLLPMAFAAFVGIGLLAPVVKLFSGEELGMRETDFGITLILAAAIVVVASVPLGVAGDRVGRARMVQLGLATVTAALWAIALSSAKWSIVFLAALLGIGFMAIVPAWMAIVVSRGGGEHRGAAVGAVAAIQGVGMVVGTSLGGWLYESVGHRAPFIGSAMAVSLALLLALALRERTAVGEEGIGWRT
jgi:DHA1 family multidrug resistance protein-like MFS transporter